MYGVVTPTDMYRGTPLAINRIDTFSNMYGVVTPSDMFRIGTPLDIYGRGTP